MIIVNKPPPIASDYVTIEHIVENVENIIACGSTVEELCITWIGSVCRDLKIDTYFGDEDEVVNGYISRINYIINRKIATFFLDIST